MCPGLVLGAINACDVDARKELYAGVVLTGGTALLPNLRDRLEKELGASVPQVKGCWVNHLLPLALSVSSCQA